MDLFVIDTQPNENIEKEFEDSEDEDEVCEVEVSEQPAETVDSTEEDDDYGGLPPPSKNISDIIREARADSFKAPEKIDISLLLKRKKQAEVQNKQAGKTEKNKWKPPELDKGIQSIIQEGLQQSGQGIKPIESEKSLKKVTMSERKLLKIRKTERSKTKGEGWFNLSAPEITEEVKNELEIIKMRSVLDTKHFYKRSEMKSLPKYFEVGKILPTPLEHYSDRSEGKASKAKSLVDELMANAEFQKQNKRRYREALENKKTTGYYKAAQKMKKLKKRK